MTDDPRKKDDIPVEPSPEYTSGDGSADLRAESAASGSEVSGTETTSALQGASDSGLKETVPTDKESISESPLEASVAAAKGAAGVSEFAIDPSGGEGSPSEDPSLFGGTENAGAEDVTPEAGSVEAAASDADDPVDGIAADGAKVDPAAAEEPAATGEEGAAPAPTGGAPATDAPASGGTGGDGGGNDGDDDEDEDEEYGRGSMSLLEHLDELRVRLTRSLFAVVVGFLACYGFAKQLFDIVKKPMLDVLRQTNLEQNLLPPDFFERFGDALTKALTGSGFPYPEKLQPFVEALKTSMDRALQQGHFQYTSPPEAFFAYLKVSAVAGIFLVSPYIFWQLWAFIAPGLYKHERRYVVPVAMASAIFFVTGACFGYFVVFPYGFQFFAQFISPDTQFIPKLSEFLSFSLRLLFAFGVAFEMPVFVFFLARLGMATARGLRKKQKYAILVSFIIGAVLTPPDPMTQSLMAGPLILLYELSIWIAYLFGKKRAPDEDDEDDKDDEDTATAAS